MENNQNFLRFLFIFDLEKLKADLECVSCKDWVSHPNIKDITDENVDEVILSLKIIGSDTALKMAKELEIKKDFVCY